MFPQLFGLDLQITLHAEPLFRWGPLVVTNSILYGLICSVFIVALMIVAARNISLLPGKGYFYNAIDYMVDKTVEMLEGVFVTRKRAAEFAPYFSVYFIFIFFTNLLELVPWVSDSVYRNFGNGVHSMLLRPFTADLNGTLAMAIVAIVMVQYLSIRRQGLKSHMKHYYGDKPTNPINFFIGTLEVFGELTRVMSLSLRLFLNTVAGDILLKVFASLILANDRTPLLVLPIFLFEALVAYIQAYVFMMLAGTYLGLAVGHSPYEDDHHRAGSPKQVEEVQPR